jgi:hypothetical protein
MNLNSPLFDRVRIRRGQAEGEARIDGACQHPGCKDKALYRAPMGRDREGQYLYFCLPHVQEYNKTYNYFNGMSDEAIQRFQKDALTGHRPTWSMGARREEQHGAVEDQIHDVMGLFEEARRKAGGLKAKPEPQRSRFGLLAQKALETLDITEAEATPAAIRARYKTWVKRLHPDANGGDRSREEKLREIIKAYNTLKSAGHA